MLKTQKKLLTAFGVKTKEKGLWSEVPVSDKSQLRKARVPTVFSELRVTSGSTGDPLYIFYSKEALHSFVKRAVISLKKSGVSRKNRVLNLFAYGNYVPGSMYEKACQLEDIPIIPLGAPNTYPKEKMVEVILKLKPDVWLAVPSYAISLLELLPKGDDKILPKKVIVAGERLLDSYIEKFKEYNVEVINHFGLTECPAIGVSKKGNPKIIEIINDDIYTESVEENGLQHFVVTDLNNSATPIIRYKTGDVIDTIKYNKDGTLAEFRIVGRSDDLTKIQGILVSKTKIIETLSGITDTFIVDIKTVDGRDFVEVTLPKALEAKESVIDAQLPFLKKRKLIFKEEVVVPKTSSYKNKHIIDSRK